MFEDHHLVFVTHHPHSIHIQSLHDKRVLSLDLSAIIAGSGVRGQFEEKFKALLRDIEDEVCNI